MSKVILFVSCGVAYGIMMMAWRLFSERDSKVENQFVQEETRVDLKLGRAASALMIRYN